LLAFTQVSSAKASLFDDELVNVNQYTRFIIDEGANWSSEEAIAHLSDYQEADREVYNFGMNDDALWIHLDLSKNKEGLDQLCILEPRITLLDVYTLESGLPSSIYSSGQGRAHATRLINVPIYQLDLSELAPHAKELLIRVVDRDKRNIPLYMGGKWAASKYHRNRALSNGLYFGLLFVMILYNTFIYIGVKDKNYLYYIIFLALISLAQGHMSGLAQFYLYPEIELFKVRGSSIFSPMAGCMAIIFIMNILATRRKMPVLHVILYISIASYLTAIMLSTLTESKFAYFYMQAGNLLGSFTVLICAIQSVYRKSITAIFILVGWSFLITGIVLYVLTEIGVLTYRFKFSPHLIQLGSSFEVLFFSFALAERINRYKVDKLIAISDNERLLRDSIEVEKENTHKLAELELTALRGQMNPHFVFNALGAIQYYMQTNENDQADIYLTKFALLMRKYLESSKTKLISLREEIDLLRLYTDLEMMRFGEKFKTYFHVDARIDLDHCLLPSMMIQPFVENAIKHGLNDRIDGEGELEIRFNQTAEGIDVAVVDNGVGMEASSEKHDTSHRSRGMELIRDRIATYQNAGEGRMSLQYTVLYPEEIRFPGTIVLLSIEHFNEAET
jgi:sensor histidine kinase YesM